MPRSRPLGDLEERFGAIYRLGFENGGKSRGKIRRFVIFDVGEVMGDRCGGARLTGAKCFTQHHRDRGLLLTRA